MKIKLLLKIVFLLTFFSVIKTNAQMTCTPTNYDDITVMNTTGGNATD